MTGQRAYDVVLFGATGFTGRLTAEYLARSAPADCRWAIAGRNPAKLAVVRERLAELNPACADLPVLHADATDPVSLRAVAESARVVITTVGPFVRHGDALVAACAEAGTDYVDSTGEPEFVDRTYVSQHDRAVRSGARLVHACGFDSIPHDLGVLFTVQQLPGVGPIRVDGFVRAGGQFSGGTYQTVLTAMSRAGSTARAAKARRAVEPRDPDRRVHLPARAPRFDSVAKSWVLPLPTIDPQIVGRSAAALPRYGPDFSYSHHAAVKRLPIALGGVAALGALIGLAQIPPARNWLAGRLQAGAGPSPERRAASWFTVRFVGREGDQQVITEVSGGDPGYEETSKMLAESALCLAFDDLPATGGQLTPATAMGEVLIDRLVRAGLRFQVLDTAPASPPSRMAARG